MSAAYIEIIRYYAAHDSWRCDHPPHFYLASKHGPLPEGTCACGLVDALHNAGLHQLADEFDPRKRDSQDPEGETDG